MNVYGAGRRHPGDIDARARLIGTRADDRARAAAAANTDLSKRVEYLEALSSTHLTPSQSVEYARLRRIGTSEADAIMIAINPPPTPTDQLQPSIGRPMLISPDDPVNWRMFH